MNPLLKILKNTPNIISGWWNYIFPQEASDKRAAARAEQCKTCPYLVDSIIQLADNKFPWLEAKKCGLCNCPSPAKVRARKEKCDAGKW